MGEETNFDLLQKIVNKYAVETFISYREKCIDQINTEHANPHRSVAIVREYGRKWDKEAEEEKLLEKGGFVKLMKKQLNKLPLPQIYKDSFYYL